MRRIKERGEALFSELCNELGMTRDVIIVTFLAILELIRRHRLAFEQPEAFDDIRLFLRQPHDRDREIPLPMSGRLEEAISRLQRPVEALLFVASEALSIHAARQAASTPKSARSRRCCSRSRPSTANAASSCAKSPVVIASPRRRSRATSSKRICLPPKTSLSTPALEALAIVAHLQPVTRSEIEAIRGVNSDSVVSTLLDRGLIAEAGRKDVVGRPMQYKTTPFFLESFGLRSLDDLPELELEPGQPLEFDLGSAEVS